MTGHIRKRGERSWAILIDLPRGPDGKRRRKWHTVHGNKKDAQRKRNELLHQLETGAYVEPTKMTITEFLERWLKHVRSKVGGKTFERYSEIVHKNLIPSLGALRLPQLQPIHIEEFYAEMLESGRKNGNGGLSPRTVVHFHRVLRAALQQGIKWKFIVINQADAVEPPNVEPKEMNTLDASRTAWLFTAAEGTRLYVPIVLESTLGIRRGEVLALQWSDLNLSTSIATVRRSLQETNEGLKFKSTKSGKGRPVSLLEFTVETLNQHKKEQEKERASFGADYQDNDLVCPLPDGSPWPPDSFSDQFRRFRDKCGLKIRYHDLRHSHATQLMEQGIHPKIVSERLGHSSVGITLDLYSHVMPGMQEEAAQRLDAVLRGAIKKEKGGVQ